MNDRRTMLKAAAGLAVGGVLPLAAPVTAALGAPLDLRPGERYVEVPGGRVWVNVVGSGRRPPLLVLHGGPGAGHDYLEPLGDLAADRPVVFYDQLGCGRSDKPDNPSLWTVNRFVAEVWAVRRALNLGRFHLYGHSWGGWLAIEYLLRQPRGVEAVVLASTSASAAQFVAGTRHLRTLLPPDVQRVLDYYEANGDFTAPEYLDAVNVFYQNFFCRLDPYPDALLRSGANIDGNQVYATMNGPNEFSITGNLASWDRFVAGVPHQESRAADTWTLRRVRRALHGHAGTPSPTDRTGRVREQRAHGHAGGAGRLHPRPLLISVGLGPDRQKGARRRIGLAAAILDRSPTRQPPRCNSALMPEGQGSEHGVAHTRRPGYRSGAGCLDLGRRRAPRFRLL